MSYGKKVNKKDFIRYDEGAERYSMSKHSFMKLAQEAHAVYKINRITLVNVPILRNILNLFVCKMIEKWLQIIVYQKSVDF